MIPFNVTIAKENRDPDLADKLKAEWPAILRWMIDGCLIWQSDGLKPPVAVIDATNQYLEAEDTVAAWTTEKCDFGKDKRATSALLFASFKAWAEKNGEFVGTQRGLIDKLLRHPGLERTPDKNLRYWASVLNRKRSRKRYSRMTTNGGATIKRNLPHWAQWAQSPETPLSRARARGRAH